MARFNVGFFLTLNCRFFCFFSDTVEAECGFRELVLTDI